jgi:hypothetical protein
MISQRQYAINAFRSGGAYYRRRPGLADYSTGQRIAGGAGSAAGGFIAAANSNLPTTSRIGAGVTAAGGVVAMIPGGQIPGAIIALAGTLTSLIGGLFKPDLTKIEATKIVDDVEARVLKPAVQNWRALPADQKTQSMQAHYLGLVDSALDSVQRGCSNPALEAAGQRCISERLVKGGTAPWCPTGTGCDWVTIYRDPIANDPEVHPDPSPVNAAVSSFFGGSDNGPAAGLPFGLLLGGALILIALASD